MGALGTPASLDSLGRDLMDRASRLMSDYTPQEGIRLHGDCHVGNICGATTRRILSTSMIASPDPPFRIFGCFFRATGPRRELQLAELIAGYEEFNDFDPREIKWMKRCERHRMVYYSAWLARRWEDPAFPVAFPWFGKERYWADQILALREQLACLKRSH